MPLFEPLHDLLWWRLGPARRLADRNVLLVRDPGDRHHLELCFLGFLRKLAGGDGPSWREVEYGGAGESDWDGCHLVVLCRPRFPECSRLLDRCAALDLPVLVMIDDNWPAAGEELPRYSHLFAPGCAPLEVFLDAVRRADATLVYSPLLAAELTPMARRIALLPPNVDLDLFGPGAEPPRADGRILVGYAGSPRFECSAFTALSQLVRTRSEVDLLFFGHELPPELAGLPADRLRFLPWEWEYRSYARKLALSRPDILVAPLEASRFAASKCPNKFLEIAAVGAAGVYSRVEPYLSYVRSGVTGLLVENRVEDWLRALERLCDDPRLRLRLARRARTRVRRRFATGAVLPRFARLLDGLARPAAQPTRAATAATYSSRR